MNLSHRPGVPLWLLGLFTFSGPVGMHIFVPALPAAAKDLHARPAALELTISLYILGLAVGQLVYGPASDRFGRRPALLVGLSIFTIASVAGLFAPDVHTLVLARFFQALGGCSGLVLARAIIRDTSQAHEAARRLALTNLLVTAGPAVAPLIGSGLSALWGWQTILAGLAALGVANFILAWRILPETRPEALFVSASRYARDYVGLLRSRQFLGYAVGGACATTSLYAFIACAPFIFIDRLHVPSASVGLYLALLVSGIWLGSLLASRLIARFSLARFVVVANVVSVVAAAAFLGFVIADRATLVAIVGTMFVFSVGVGAAAPAALVKAISVNPRVTGTASGLYGSVQMGVAGRWLCTPAGGRTRRSPPRPCSLPQALWRRRHSGSHETGAQPSPRRKPRPCQKRRLSAVTRRVLRARRGSRSGERLPEWEARAAAAPSPPAGSSC
jgi:DHA1 family bicyclomycin/chloramphenicol resistance-like MFS transporter